MVHFEDALTVTALPYWSASRKFPLGTTQYQPSQLHDAEGRANGGMGIGFAPIREET